MKNKIIGKTNQKVILTKDYLKENGYSIEKTTYTITGFLGEKVQIWDLSNIDNMPFYVSIGDYKVLE